MITDVLLPPKVNFERWLLNLVAGATSEEVDEAFVRLRMVNRTLQSLGLETVPAEAMRTRRRVLSPFESSLVPPVAAAVIPTTKRQWLDC